MQQKLTRMRLQEERRNEEMAEMRDCTFHPQICYKDKLVRYDSVEES